MFSKLSKSTFNRSFLLYVTMTIAVFASIKTVTLRSTFTANKSEYASFLGVIICCLTFSYKMASRNKREL